MVHLCKQFLIAFLMMLAVLGSRAQQYGLDTLAIKADLASMQSDSLIKALRGMMDSSGQRESFFSANLSASNSLFSSKNDAFNAQQSNSGVMAILPSVSYYHKTGFGMSATVYARKNDASVSVSQLALSPTYDHVGKTALYGISYTRYLKQKDPLTAVTPYDNELYAYIQSRKTWLRPSLALGWAEGKYQDVSTVPVKRNGNYFWIVDTSNVFLKDFSVNAAISHAFTYSGVLSKNDMFSIVPQLSLIAGVQGFSTVTRSTVVGIRSREAERDRVRKVYNVSSAQVSNFTIQTAAFSTNASWYRGSFALSVGYFLAYYFDDTLVKKTAHIFNFGMGLTF